MNLLAAVPVYNEAPFIAAVVSGIQEQGVPLIVVDDGSTDGSGDRAREAGARVIEHAMNEGKGKAIATSFSYAKENGYDAVIFLDGDGQHDPKEISRFITAAEKPGCDFVIGNRMDNAAAMPWLNYITNVSLSWLTGILVRTRIHDSQVGYRLIKNYVWDACPIETTRFDHETEFLIQTCRAGFRIQEVPITTIYGDEVSKINPWIDVIRYTRLFLRAFMLPDTAWARRHRPAARKM